MKIGWRTVRIGDTCEVIAGQSPKGSSYNKTGEGLPFYQGKKEFTDKYIGPPTTWTTQVTKEANAGDILMSVRAPVGPINFATEKICIGRGLAAIRGQDEIDRDFLFYTLLSIQPEISGNEGAVFASINKKQIESIEISLPPLDEQKRIVAILDEAFAGIETAIANTEKNLANASELFESYLNAVFNQPAADWVEKPVGEFAEHYLGKMLDKNKNKGVPRPYLRNLNVQWFSVDTNDILEMKIEEKEEARYRVERGDLLICEGGYPGRAALWNTNEPVFFQKALHRVRCHDKIYNRWLMYYLYLMDASGKLKQHFTGAGIQHFTGKALNHFKVPLAPVSEAEKIISSIEDLQKETLRLESIHEQKLTAHAELKQSLLQKAFSGELTSETEKEVEEAVA